jgi:Ala-tRNA(Pro) deacylase
VNKHEIVDRLTRSGIAFTIVEHPPAHTVEDIDSLQLAGGEHIVKNLFLRDDKKQHYYLLVLQKDKSVNLKQIRQLLGSRPLSFASEEDLFLYLGLKKGAVTPLGILNDSDRRVELLLDNDLQLQETVGVHPNENTATVWLSLTDLTRIIQTHGNRITYLDV